MKRRQVADKPVAFLGKCSAAALADRFEQPDDSAVYISEMKVPLYSFPLGLLGSVCFVVIVTAGTWLPTSLAEQTQSPTPQKAPTPQRASHEDISAPEKFNFSLGGDRYEIRNVGKGIRTRSGEIPQKFGVKVDKGVIEPPMFFFQYKNDLVLVYGLTDHDYSWGKLARLHERSLQSKWSAHIPGFNIGQGLVEDHFLYLTAINFVAKLDLDSGKYVWQHGGLKEPDAHKGDAIYESGGNFNSFDQPWLDGRAVVFPVNPQVGPKRSDVVLRIDKTTGKLLPTCLPNC